MAFIRIKTRATEEVVNINHIARYRPVDFGKATEIIMSDGQYLLAEEPFKSLDEAIIYHSQEA